MRAGIVPWIIPKTSAFWVVIYIMKLKIVPKRNMVITGNQDNQNLHLRWYTNAINPHLVVPLALPGMTKEIDSVT